MNKIKAVAIVKEEGQGYSLVEFEVPAKSVSVTKKHIPSTLLVCIGKIISECHRLFFPQ